MNSVTRLKAGNVLAHSIDGETVILNLDNEKYFTLDSVATRFWEVVLDHGHSDDAIRVLLEEYDVDRDTLVTDMDRWIDETVRLGLLVPDQSNG